MNFLGLQINNPAVLAPMAGWTNSAFRKMCRKFGANLCFTEMISAEGLINDDAETLRLAHFDKDDRPIGLQLFGSSAGIMACAAKKAARLGPDFIDLNFGCAVKKIVSRGSGSALLKELDLLRDIAKSVCSEIDIPVTAKIRLGWENNQAVEIAQLLQESGISGITVHARTKMMKYNTPADWLGIKLVKESVNIPVIGNGDVFSPADALKMKEITGCDLVMIGRASRGNPWIFRQTHDLFAGKATSRPGLHEKIDVCLELLNDLCTLCNEKKAILDVRKHMKYFLSGLPDSRKICLQLFERKKIQEIEHDLTELKKRLEV